MTLPRPSSAHIWTHCDAYPTMAARVPPAPESDAAREGTCAAWLAEQAMTTGRETTDFLGATHPNGWVVTREMTNHIAGYVALLRSYGGKVDVERKVALNEIIAGTPDAFGVLANDELRVDDLKYGMLVVEVWENPQVMIYAGALLRLLYARGVTIRTVRLGIYQPRVYHPFGIHRIWTLYPEELMARVREIEAAGYRTQNPNASARAGAHCRYCEAAAQCAANANQVREVVHTMHHAEMRPMTAKELAAELTFIDAAEAMFKGRRDAVRAEAEARVQKGEAIPGWMIEQGYGQRQWVLDDPLTIEMMTGVDVKAKKMITPAEAERQGADPEIVKMLTRVPRTKASLKPIPPGYVAAKFGEM
jgi:hypothetical protein